MSFDLLALGAPALISGVAAALCLTAAPMFRRRSMILLAQLGAGICFSTHYALLGISVAAAANMLGLVQIVAAMQSTRSAAMNRLGYALIGLMILAGLWFWQGPISLLSMAAMILIALGRMQTNELYLRLLLLGGGGFWIAHDFIGQAWIALAADIGAILAGLATLLSIFIRITIEWRPLAPSPALPAG